MADFNPKSFKIKDENRELGAIRVVKLDTGPGPQVKPFSLPEIEVRGKGDYSVVKSKYGSLAATDLDRRSKTTRDRRFSVNPLLRDPLAIEEEERRVIDRRVQDSVGVISEKARQEGENRGYEAGLKKGRDEAFEQFASQSAESISSLESLVKSFEALKSEIFKANERFLLEMVFRVAKMIALKEISADQEYVTRLSKDLLERVGIRDHIHIRMNPKDAASIETLKAELSKSFPDLKNLSIEVSDDVQGGGCELETPWSALDASIETQLQGLHDALVGSAAGGAPSENSVEGSPEGSPKGSKE